MARTNAACGAWVSELLEIGPDESVLEVGFGPGIVIHLLSKLAGHVAGIDPSQEMVEQARSRNAKAIVSGRVDLRHGTVEKRHSTTTPLMRRSRSTRCKFGRMQ
jgi:ubiquinone/menaquinone biosynthesis C-methylase UbiE